MKVSIITVVYNNKKTIKDAIESVLDQSYKNIEYIIVDGASNDGTVDIIKSYGSKITKFISEPDRGLYDAMNKGVKLATGDWINFMNSGDSFYSNDVLKNVFLKNNYKHISVIFGNHNVVYPNKIKIKKEGDIKNI